MLVSVLVNNYNYDRFLGEAIDSALDQTHPDTEVVVVDDGSTDGSREIIAGYGDRIVPVLKENGGQVSAFNAGFAASRGDLIAFLDSDDAFHENKVARMVEFLSEVAAGKEDVLVYHDLELVDAEGASLGRRFPRYLKRHDPNLFEYARTFRYLPYVASTTSGISISRPLAARIFPLPNECLATRAEDFVVKAATLLGEVHGTDEVLSKYRVHGENHWYGDPKPPPEEFFVTEHEFLNTRLKQHGLEPTVSFFDSVYAGDFYTYHRRCRDMTRLAFGALRRFPRSDAISPNINPAKFAAKMLLLAALMRLRSRCDDGR